MIYLWVSTLAVFWVLPMGLIFLREEWDFRQPTDRVLWFIVVFFLPVAGGLLYLVVRLLARLLQVSGTLRGATFPQGSYRTQDTRRA